MLKFYYKYYNKIESLNPWAIIAGHKRPGTDDDPRSIEVTRQYIRDFDRLAESSKTARELYDQMLKLHPDGSNPHILPKELLLFQ